MNVSQNFRYFFRAPPQFHIHKIVSAGCWITNMEEFLFELIFYENFSATAFSRNSYVSGLIQFTISPVSRQCFFFGRIRSFFLSLVN